MDIAAIHTEATEAAVKASKDALTKMGGDNGTCGFAWCTIRGVKLNTKVGKAFAQLEFTKGSGANAGIELWNPSGHQAHSIDILVAGARAYAEVFRQHGFDARTNSRVD